MVCVRHFERALTMKFFPTSIVTTSILITLILITLITILGSSLAASAETASLTADPLTGLPLFPATDPGLHLGNQPGNAPTKIPDTQVCKSKMEANFYSVFGVKMDATVAWYAAHLQGFHKAHGYTNQRSKDLFYNDAGTMVVSVMGNRGKDGENTEVFSVTYYRFQPGLTAKTIISIGQDKFVCQ
jgi:hypothetical protein